MVHMAVQHMKDQDSSKASVSLPSTNPSLALSVLEGRGLVRWGQSIQTESTLLQPNIQSCKTYCKVSGWKGGSLALKRSLLYPCHLRSRFIMLYYKSVHRSPIQLAYQILYGQIVNGLSELEIREFTELVMIHNKRVCARCVLPAPLLRKQITYPKLNHA